MPDLYSNREDIIDDNRNDSIINELVDLLINNRPTCFVGAGLSMASPLNYPSWSNTIEGLGDYAEINCYLNPDEILKCKNNNKLIWAENLKIAMEKSVTGEYARYITKTFGPKVEKCTETQRQLLKIPFKHIVTTNYDPSLEYADTMINHTTLSTIVGMDNEKIGDLLQELTNPNNEKKIIHIHGFYNDIKSIVLTQSEFIDAYKLENLLRNFLFTVLSTTQLLFIGFSFNEEDQFTQIARTINLELRQIKSNYALIGLIDDEFDDIKKRIEKRKYYQREFNVKTIFYKISRLENDLENHDELDTILNKIILEYERKVIRPPQIKGYNELNNTIKKAEQCEVKHPSGSDRLKALMSRTFHI